MLKLVSSIQNDIFLLLFEKGERTRGESHWLAGCCKIDPSTVFGAILVGGQTQLNLKKMYGILADFEPL